MNGEVGERIVGEGRKSGGSKSSRSRGSIGSRGSRLGEVRGVEEVSRGIFRVEVIVGEVW